MRATCRWAALRAGRGCEEQVQMRDEFDDERLCMGVEVGRRSQKERFIKTAETGQAEGIVSV